MSPTAITVFILTLIRSYKMELLKSLKKTLTLGGGERKDKKLILTYLFREVFCSFLLPSNIQAPEYNYVVDNYINWTFSKVFTRRYFVIN